MSAAEPRQADPVPDDKVDEAVEGTFPASDPPAYQSTVTSGAPYREAEAPPKRNAPVMAIVAVAAVIVLLWALFG